MTEDEIIQRYFVTPVTRDDVYLGIGDDAAILTVAPGHQLVMSVDTLLEGVHFPIEFSPQDLASRAVAVCVSDLAAMGAMPQWLTLGLTLPDIDENWLQKFSQALHQHCTNYGMQLVGGDTVKGTLALTLNVMGVVETGQALRRDKAKTGDLVYVSGSLGGASYALSKCLDNTEMDTALWTCFSCPQARTDLGRSLIGLANSCMDISDGILLDASRLAKASGLGISVNLEQLPLHSSLKDLSFEHALKFATGGDDYELLFTTAPENIDKLNEISENLDLSLSCIGEVTFGTGLECRYQNRAYDVQVKGYQHFV